MKVPPHIHCAGFGHSIRQSVEAAEKLLKLSDLNQDQPKKKKADLDKDTHNKEVGIWYYTNPIWLLWKALQYLRAHKVGTFIGSLIVILTLLATDYSLAWQNSKTIWEWLVGFFNN